MDNHPSKKLIHEAHKGRGQRVIFYLEASNKWSTLGLFWQPVLLNIFINGLTALSSSPEITPNLGAIVDTFRV